MNRQIICICICICISSNPIWRFLWRSGWSLFGDGPLQSIHPRIRLICSVVNWKYQNSLREIHKSSTAKSLLELFQNFNFSTLVQKFWNIIPLPGMMEHPGKLMMSIFNYFQIPPFSPYNLCLKTFLYFMHFCHQNVASCVNIVITIPDDQNADFNLISHNWKSSPLHCHYMFDHLIIIL